MNTSFYIFLRMDFFALPVVGCVCCRDGGLVAVSYLCFVYQAPSVCTVFLPPLTGRSLGMGIAPLCFLGWGGGGYQTVAGISVPIV